MTLAMNYDRNYIRLHLVVFLTGVIPTMIKGIRLPTLELVILRLVLATAILGGIVLLRKKTRQYLPPREAINVLLTGPLLALFWTFYTLAVQLGNASITLIGMATVPIWVSLCRPFFTGRAIRFTEIMTGLNAVFGFFMIFNSGFGYNAGLLLAIIGAFFGALLTVISARFAQRHEHYTVTFFQMGGALLTLGAVQLALSVWPALLPYGMTANWQMPSLNDLLLLLVLAILVSVVAYATLIKVMQQLSPFTVALTNNLAPIYGILTALVLNGSREQMTLYFYSGATIILASVFAYPVVYRFFRGQAATMGTAPPA